MTDASSQLAEKATYCKVNDKKRPELVGLPDATTTQICPEDFSKGADEVDTAYPDGWYVRVMFDELLDPSIETLTEILDDDGNGTGTFEGSIKDTHPVKLECQSVTGAMVNVDYDGYYSPAGNAVTWPLGPSLVIKPNAPKLIATGKECQLTLSTAITDKDFNPVPAGDLQPFKFKIAQVTPIATDPTDSADETMPTKVDALGPYYDNFYFQFNTDVQKSSFCDDTDFGGTFNDSSALSFTDAQQGFGQCDAGTEKFELSPPVTTADAGGFWGLCSSANILDQEYCSVASDCVETDARCEGSYVYTYSGASADDEIGIGYDTPLKTEQAYTFSIKPGTKLKDRCGAETTTPAPTADNMYSIRFKTNKFEFKKITIADGEIAAMSKKPNIQFDTVIDTSSIAAGSITLVEANGGAAPAGAAAGQFTGGEYIMGGNFKIDTQYVLTIKGGTTVKDFYGAIYTFPATDTVVHWKTAPKLLLTSSTADKTVITKSADKQLVGISMSFNANMDRTTLTTADFTLVDKDGKDMTTLPSFVIGNGSGAAGANCSATSQSCQLRVRANFPPGDYTFTLKKDAQINDKLANIYTQEKDLVIHFTVKAPVPPTQCL